MYTYGIHLCSNPNPVRVLVLVAALLLGACDTARIKVL